MKVSKEVAEMLETKEGRERLIALKLCELVEVMRKPVSQPVSMWKTLFGHDANE